MFILSFVLVCLSCVLVWKGVKRKRESNWPPLYPGAWPITGHVHLLGFWNEDTSHLWHLAQVLSEGIAKLGGVVRLSLGLVDYFVITDPQDINTAANACFDKNYCYKFGKSWLGDGLITGDAAVWKRHRKLVIPAFNQQVLDSFLSIFNIQAKTLANEFEVQVGKGYFQHSPYLDHTALESIYQTAIGINAEDEKAIDKKAFTDAENVMLNIAAQRFQTVWMHLDFLFQFTSLKKRQDKALKVVNDTYNVVMDIKKSAGKKKDQAGKKYRSFLDLLLSQTADGSLTHKEVWEEVNTIIVAGHDTVASALTILLIILGSYPDVQEKVVQELKEVFEDKYRDVEKNDLPRLVYLEMVIKESIRMYPLGVAMIRYAAQDLKLKNYTVPAGSSCVLMMYGAHRHPVWGEDRDKFNPERWTDSSPEMNHAFAGFGVGKRNCLGKTYAMMFLKTTIAHVLRRYRITSDISKLKLKLDILLKPASGDVIAIEERNY